MAIKDIALSAKTNLVSVLEDIGECHTSFYPQNMEALNQSTGYIFYRTKLNGYQGNTEKVRLIDTRDRAQVFLNGNHIVTQYQEEIGDDIQVNFTSEESQLDILVENMGRVNYGHKLTAPSQHKGIGRGVMLDLHFVNQWETYPLSMNSIKTVSYTHLRAHET